MSERGRTVIRLETGEILHEGPTASSELDRSVARAHHERARFFEAMRAIGAPPVPRLDDLDVPEHDVPEHEMAQRWLWAWSGAMRFVG